jgi:hypothetical protein
MTTIRRRWRNSDDPTFQGDGWRWTLSFHLPWPLDLLVLTPAQRDACYRERAAFLAEVDQATAAAAAAALRALSVDTSDDTPDHTCLFAPLDPCPGCEHDPQEL